MFLRVMISDIVTFITIVSMGCYYGVRHVIDNWTKEDSVDMCSCIGYMLLAYTALVIMILM